MCTWNKNNRACTTTWTTLRVLDQNMKVFNDSGEVKMSNLTFWNPTASSEMRKFQATSLANQIDNVFILIRKAKYENNVTKEKAITDITNTFINENKTICDLAEVIDSDYLFWGEEQ